jgi:tetratricopeptide (TPR) repeat protein
MPTKSPTRSAYERDVDAVERALAALAEEPPSAARAAGIASRLYRRATLTGAIDQLGAAAAVADDGLRQFGPWPDLAFMKATIDFALHRLAGARASLALAPALQESPEGRVLAADLDLQEGRYDDARRGYARALEDGTRWDALARLAHLELQLGDDRAADDLYAQAADELTAKELRSYAWIEIQRGVVHLSRGRSAEAERHYLRAQAAYSGDWVADEHIAELRAVQGRIAEALALYHGVVARVPRPELQQALGDLYAFAGRTDEARPWHDRALAGYLASVSLGEVHYYHHLASFYADVRVDGAEAVRFATLDLGLRRNAATLAALAWASYRAGRIADAVDAIDAALAFGMRSAHLLFAAGTIYEAAGRADGGRLLADAVAIDARGPVFRAHR